MTLASETVKHFKEIVSQAGKAEMISIFMRLTEYVGDQTAMLSLSLAALMLESP